MKPITKFDWAQVYELKEATIDSNNNVTVILSSNTNSNREPISPSILDAINYHLTHETYNRVLTDNMNRVTEVIYNEDGIEYAYFISYSIRNIYPSNIGSKNVEELYI